MKKILAALVQNKRDPVCAICLFEIRREVTRALHIS